MSPRKDFVTPLTLIAFIDAHRPGKRTLAARRERRRPGNRHELAKNLMVSFPYASRRGMEQVPYPLEPQLAGNTKEGAAPERRPSVFGCASTITGRAKAL
jgi:hypothetical protein